MMSARQPPKQGAVVLRAVMGEKGDIKDEGQEAVEENRRILSAVYWNTCIIGADY